MTSNTKPMKRVEALIAWQDGHWDKWEIAKPFSGDLDDQQLQCAVTDAVYERYANDEHALIELVSIFCIEEVGGEAPAAGPTPGPWRVGHGNTVVADSEIGTYADADNIAAYGGALIAESIRTAANARLMAAAPSLLATLELLVDLVYVPDADCRCHVAPPCNDCVEYSGLREALDAARAAIAKATGKGAAHGTTE